MTFTPKLAGVRNGAVVLSDSGGSPIATAYVYGMGTGPQIAFGPPLQTTLLDAASSGLNQPFGIAIDGAGNIYLADTGNARILKETLSGGSYTQTVIGSGWISPYSVAVDAAGSLYITDGGNNRVEKLTVATPLALNFVTPTTDGTIDSVDSVQSVTMTNIGNAPQLFAIPGTGTNPSISADFALATGSAACPTLTSNSSMPALWKWPRAAIWVWSLRQSRRTPVR